MNPSTLPITVAFASDDGYAPYLLVAVSSLLQHLPQKRSCSIVVMDSGISSYYKERLHEVVSHNHTQATLQFLSVALLDEKLNEFFARRGKKGRVTNGSFTSFLPVSQTAEGRQVRYPPHFPWRLESDVQVMQHRLQSGNDLYHSEPLYL